MVKGWGELDMDVALSKLKLEELFGAPQVLHVVPRGKACVAPSLTRRLNCQRKCCANLKVTVYFVVLDKSDISFPYMQVFTD